LDVDDPNQFDVDEMKEDSTGISDLGVRTGHPMFSPHRDNEFSTGAAQRKIDSVPIAYFCPADRRQLRLRRAALHP
jgi:hypothetical protein